MNTIPLPPFPILEFVNDQTNRFIRGTLKPHAYDLNVYHINEFLSTLNSNHRLQAISLLINDCVNELETHRKKCLRGANCDSEKSLKQMLYDLYNLIEEFNINPYEDSFTTEEIFTNNDKLDKIINALDVLLAGQQAVLEEVDVLKIEQAKQALQQAKEIQVLGKQKWYIFMLGIALQMATQAIFQNVFDNHFLTYFQQFRDELQRLLK